MRTLPVALLLTLAAACGVTTGVSDGALTAWHASGQLGLRNHAATPLGYFAAGRASLAIVDWIPCTGPHCRTIPARGELIVPDSGICLVVPGETEVVVYWWPAESDSAARVPMSSIRSLIVPL